MGPFSAGVAADQSTDRAGRTPRPGDAAMAAARATNRTLRDLAAAGCPFVEIHEPALAGIGGDPEAWALVRDLHAAMTDGVDGIHLSLAITGGSVDQAGFDALLSAPFASFAVDLIAGPANWRFVRVVPGDRGIVCGALAAAPDGDEGPETLLWAAAYAASSHGRGRDRVGLSTASSLAGLPWDVAVRKLERLGAAVRLAQRIRRRAAGGPGSALDRRPDGRPRARRAASPPQPMRRRPEPRRAT